MEEDMEIEETGEISLRKGGILEVMERFVTRIKVDTVMEVIEEIHVEVRSITELTEGSHEEDTIITLMKGEGIIEQVQAVKEMIGELMTVNGGMNPGDMELMEGTAEMIHVDITVMIMIEETQGEVMMIESVDRNHATSHGRA